MQSYYQVNIALTTASSLSQLEAQLYNLLHASLQFDRVTTTGRKHGLTACQPFPNGEILLSAFCESITSELAGLNSIISLLSAKQEAVNAKKVQFIVIPL